MLDDGGLADRIRETLRACARDGRTVTYRELAALCQVPPPHTIHKTTLALEDLARADHDAGRPLLAALAVSRGGAGIPGPGFFQLLAALGRYQGPDRGPQAEMAHRIELTRAIDYWGQTTN